MNIGRGFEPHFWQLDLRNCHVLRLQTFDKFSAGVVSTKDLMPLMQMCGLIPTHADVEKVIAVLFGSVLFSLFFVCRMKKDNTGLTSSCLIRQDGRVVKALDLSSNGGIPAWVRTPLLVIFFFIYLQNFNLIGFFPIRSNISELFLRK